jgi:hypothetical protein
VSARLLRMVSLLFAGVALLVPTIACLLLVAAPSDPAEGGEQTLRIFRLLSILLSTVFGSLAMMLFIRAFLVCASRGVRSRKWTATVGAALMGVAFLLMFLLLANGAAPSGYFVLVASIIWYAGGGTLLTAWARSPTADHVDLTAP